MGRKIYTHLCLKCSKEYTNKDSKGVICPQCKSKKKFCKACGRSVSYFSKTDFCSTGCAIRGKTYKEIYGNKEVKCGFRKGEENVAKDLEVRKRISKGVTESYNDELRDLRSRQVISRLKEWKFSNRRQQWFDGEGNKFRSKFEISVKDRLVSLGIKFNYNENYEKPLLIKGKRILPDFSFSSKDVVGSCSGKTIIIEVTGFSSITEKLRQCLVDRIYNIVTEDKEDRYRIFLITTPDMYSYYATLFWKLRGKVHVFSYGVPKLDTLVRNLSLEGVTKVDYAHILPWHSGKCRFLHGHSAKIDVEVKGVFGVEDYPWLIDFGELKKAIKEVCDSYDHTFLVSKEDCETVLVSDKKFSIIFKDKNYKFTLPKESVQFVSSSTAESISCDIAQKILNELPLHILEIKVKWYEGAGNAAIGISNRDSLENRNFLSDDFLDVIKYHARF